MKSIKECLQNRRLQWFGYLERTLENASSSKCRNFQDKAYENVECGAKKQSERKVSKNLANDRDD